MERGTVMIVPNHRSDICNGDSGIVSGDTLYRLSVPADRDWGEEIWIHACKTSGFDHDNLSFKRVNAEPLTFEDRTWYGRNRPESL